MKKAIKVLALALCAGSTVLMAACGGTVSYKTTTSPNWEIRNSAGSELTSDSERLTHKEVAAYEIKHEKGTNTYFEYSEGGSYTTSFYAKEYDWNSSVPEEFRVADTTDIVYVYETALSLSGTITVKGAKRTFENTVTTISYFRSANDNLTPVYSKQDIVCTSPNSLTPADLASAYIEMDCVYEIYYSRNGKSAIVSTTDRSSSQPETTEKKVSASSEYSVFDASYVVMAMRSMTFSGSHTFDLMRAAEKQTSRFTASCGGKTKLDREDEEYAAIVSALDKAVESGYLIAGADEDGTINYNYNQLTLSLAADMSGPSSSYWFANVSDRNLNTCRAALIRVSETIPFGLGSLVYSLSSLEYVAIQ